MCVLSPGRVEAQWGSSNSQKDKFEFQARPKFGGGNQPSGNYPPNQQSDIVPGIFENASVRPGCQECDRKQEA